MALQSLNLKKRFRFIPATGLVTALASLLLAASSVTAVAAAPAAGPNIYGPSQWMQDYGQAKKLAADLGLPLIVHFHASWCSPCRQMERETLGTSQLLRQLGRQAIGVKIDSDAEPELVEAFQIDALPSDVVIAPDGLIVERKSGYQPRSRYLAMVAQMSSRFQTERADAIARLQPPATPPQRPATRPQAEPRRPDPRPAAPRTQIAASDPPVQTAAPTATASPLVGLDGYCPVQIKTKRRWLKGRSEYSTTWQGVVYNLSSAADLQAFRSAPQKYAPRMLGCDPVELWTSERAVQGSVEYGAFFNGDLFLFVSAKSRNQFKVDPNRFVHLRHAFRADDVIGTRLR
ncbi:MAG: thioredoxin family protein [Planctomycetota bacterium]|jgi:YHS domain-containing protein/thiol-disulfide isomerase/thioredoxin